MGQHNDEPTLIDGLGRITLVMEVAEAIARSRPPQVFGIHGDWGLGKTSFLQMLQWHLTGDCPARTEADITEAKKNGKMEAGKCTLFTSHGACG